ncbi:MAG TPA: phosphoribosylpyrophosphate synthetase [Holosporales bacterium]|nr:phosphoribosylpyrophosphate synthetase [Holosporales bacterium]
MPLLFHFPGYESVAHSLKEHLSSCALGRATVRHFPDGESFVQLHTDVKGKDVILLCGLDQPDTKAMALLFFTKVAKELGAKSVGLVTPYLGYMRQDKKFHEGEAITSNLFAAFLSQHVDWLVTIDPHLHRHKTLEEIYTIPTKVLHAADTISAWIKENVDKPLIIGPDEESEQWVFDVAQKANAPFIVLTKKRHGDRDVEVSVPKMDSYKDHTPILVDDIISTARTMIETVSHLEKAGTKPPTCIGVHGVFAKGAYENLLKVGIKKVVTCNTIIHPSNAIDIVPLVAVGIRELSCCTG